MKNQFIEVTNLTNETFLVNKSNILLVKKVTGRPNQVELTLKFPNGLIKVLIQANYEDFKGLL